MNFGERRAMRDGQALHLSPSGWKLLEVLLRAAPNVVPRRQLEQVLWGEETPDSNALKVHLFNLRKSVNTPFNSSLIHTITGYGFALCEEKSEEEDRHENS
jgi:DNA-binding response OmpR family regulator